MQKKLRKKSAVFSATLCDELSRITRQAWQCELPLSGSSGRADVGLELGDGKYILIEIELRRRHPAHNVLKTWFWAAKSKEPVQVRLVHVLSKYYGSKQTFLDQTEFLAEQMHSAMPTASYKRIDSDFSPVQGTFGTGGAGKRQAVRAAEKIVDYLRTQGVLKG